MTIMKPKFFMQNYELNTVSSKFIFHIIKCFINRLIFSCWLLNLKLFFIRNIRRGAKACSFSPLRWFSSSEKVVMFIVQHLEPHFPQALKTNIDHVVRELYRVSSFMVRHERHIDCIGFLFILSKINRAFGLK